MELLLGLDMLFSFQDPILTFGIGPPPPHPLSAEFISHQKCSKSLAGSTSTTNSLPLKTYLPFGDGLWPIFRGYLFVLGRSWILTFSHETMVGWWRLPKNHIADSNSHVAGYSLLHFLYIHQIDRNLPFPLENLYIQKNIISKAIINY